MSEETNEPVEDQPVDNPMETVDNPVPLEVRMLALEIKKNGVNTGLWHFVSVNNFGTVMPVGGCLQRDICRKCCGASNPGLLQELNRSSAFSLIKLQPVENCENCGNRGTEYKADRCPGHETPELAEEHFAEYVAANASLEHEFEKAQMCYICAKPTNKGAIGVLGMTLALCRQHNNTNGVWRVVRYIIRRQRGVTGEKP